MSYEPRIGDLVQTAAYGDAVEVVGPYAPDLWRYRRGLGYGCAHISQITPLRPDAPGQRVRAPDCTRGVTESTLDGRDCFVVAWNGWRSTWPADRLVRIADQAPAAPVEAPPPEDVAAMDAAIGALAAYLGPTCQHCGSAIVAGLLRDTCPRGCDLTLRAAEPEPSSITLVWTIAGASGFVAPSKPGPGYERVWCAQGGGAYKMHPTKDGAIAAWREAVRR